MRTIDDIIADAQKSLEASLREAFAAGHSHAATDLKSKMASFFDSLVPPAPHVEPPAPPHEEPPAPAPEPYAEAHPMEPIVEHQPEQHYD